MDALTVLLVTSPQHLPRVGTQEYSLVLLRENLYGEEKRFGKARAKGISSLSFLQDAAEGSKKAFLLGRRNGLFQVGGQNVGVQVCYPSS